MTSTEDKDSQMSGPPPDKVGFWWSDKKCQKINVAQLEQCFRDKGFELVKLDLTRPIAPQGPFAAIIHKLSDVMARAERSDPSAQTQMKLFEVWQDCSADVLKIVIEVNYVWARDVYHSPSIPSITSLLFFVLDFNRMNNA